MSKPKVNSRTKGHSWERKTANILTEATGVKAIRLLEYQEGFGIDIKTETPIAVQCKCGKSTVKAFDGYLEAVRSTRGSTPGVIPACFFKWSWQGKDPNQKRGEYVVLSVDDFMEIFTSYLNSK